MASSSSKVEGAAILAAGAVVTRGQGSKREYLVVHRGYRNDWTFPKGKVDPGEHLVAAAVREVREETGYAIRLGLPLPTQKYTAAGQPKHSHYWHAHLVGGDFVPNDEVDELRWLRLGAATDILTYIHDRDVLNAAADAQMSDPLIVLRHTQATKRADWAQGGDSLADDDQSRPLTGVGRMQAHTLVPVLAAFGTSALHSSDSRRCRDTVSPYASARSLPIHLVPSLSEERHRDDEESAREFVASLATSVTHAALCTHRPVLPTVMTALSEALDLDSGKKKTFDPTLTPGSLVVFHRDPANLRRVWDVERHIR